MPAPISVWDEFTATVDDGRVWSILWTSISRAFIGFAIALVIATPLGLLVAKVRPVRAAIGPLLSGLQSLPSVAWVPAAILWFGLTDATIYFVVLLGSVPSIANGLVAGIDQVPPILPRVGQVLGARGLTSARHILLPAALPGYIAGCKQGWAFSWRSLMAAEIIAAGPAAGLRPRRVPQGRQRPSNMPGVIAAIFLILHRRHRHRAAGLPADRAARAAGPGARPGRVIADHDRASSDASHCTRERGSLEFACPRLALSKGSPHVIILGIILLVLGYLLGISILTTLGIILIVIGAILAILGATGRAVGGRKYWF